MSTNYLSRHGRITLICTIAAGLTLAAVSGVTIRTAPGPHSASPSAFPTPVAVAPAGQMRQVHSPGVVTDDMNLQPGQCHVVVKDGKAGQYLPDPACTPGAVDPAVRQANIGTTICASGYTKTVRPPSSNTGAAKYQSLKQYGIRYDKTIEYDHLVSLELGGANSTSNLFPEQNKADAKGVNNPKDLIENALNQAVCTRKVTLDAAQRAISTDWTTALQILGLPTIGDAR